MNLSSLADQIFRELAQPSDISIPSVAFWLKSNLGMLNTRLETDFHLDENADFQGSSPLEEAMNIFKHLYQAYYWTRRVSAAAGAASYDASVIEITEGDVTTRLVNRNEVAKTFLSMKRDVESSTNRLIADYRSNQAKPVQVSGETYRIELTGPYNLSISRRNALEIYGA